MKPSAKHAEVNNKYAEFYRCLSTETQYLANLYQQQAISPGEFEGGFELEFFLLDHNMALTAKNSEYLKQLNDKNIIAEVLQSSLEINTPPFKLEKNALSKAQRHLDITWEKCQNHADALGLNVIHIGTLGNTQLDDIAKQKTSQKPRYLQLEQELKNFRQQDTIHLLIDGKNGLFDFNVPSINIIGLLSSFQIHMNVSLAQFNRFYNAVQIVSAPLLALGCNSPFLFKQALWHESRIAIFENTFAQTGAQFTDRVSFGNDFLHDSFMELYNENLEKHPCILPILSSTATEKLQHLRLHNSTIYRWNRPVLDFNKEGKLFLRIESRVLPAGPSIIDMIANAAMFFGLVTYYANTSTAPENLINFKQAKNNFCQAARYGLNTEFIWLNNQKKAADQLIMNELIPAAEKGLEQLGIDVADAKNYLTIITERVAKKINGSQWQMRFMQKSGGDFAKLIKHYLVQQKTGQPVHLWD